MTVTMPPILHPVSASVSIQRPALTIPASSDGYGHPDLLESRYQFCSIDSGTAQQFLRGQSQTFFASFYEAGHRQQAFWFQQLDNDNLSHVDLSTTIDTSYKHH